MESFDERSRKYVKILSAMVKFFWMIKTLNLIKFFLIFWGINLLNIFFLFCIVKRKSTGASLITSDHVMKTKNEN